MKVTSTIDAKFVGIVYPRQSGRKALPPEVPCEYTEDHREASLVLLDSPKASAALSRRALQRFLREELGIRRRTLQEEIQEFVSRPDVPSYIGQAVDAVRNIGNLAAHPLKNEHTGEIVDVEPGEADWLLDVLEDLYDQYFVKPKLLEKRKDELNEKLKTLGKPIMK